MDAFPYPILEFDPEREALIEPSRLIEPRDVPQHCVICFFQEVIEKFVAEQQAKVAQDTRLSPSTCKYVLSQLKLIEQAFS